MTDSISFTIEKRLGVLSKGEKGWQKEVNLVAWNGGIVKLDVRDWDAGNSRMKKGITLTRSEAWELYDILKRTNFNEIGDYGKNSDKKSQYKGAGRPEEGFNEASEVAVPVELPRFYDEAEASVAAERPAENADEDTGENKIRIGDGPEEDMPDLNEKPQDAEETQKNDDKEEPEIIDQEVQTEKVPF